MKRMFSSLILFWNVFSSGLEARSSSSSEVMAKDGDPSGSCQNFYPDVPYNAHLLPSEIPTMNCKCVGLSPDQVCPQWTFLSGSGNATVLRNYTHRTSPYSCTSYFRFRVSNDLEPQMNTLHYKLKCTALKNDRTVHMFIKKARHNYNCLEDGDCLLRNQRCFVRDDCQSNDCSRVCRCVDPTPIFIDNSLENCYPKSDSGDSCNYTVQCQFEKRHGVICSTDGDSGNETTQGICRCPSGYSYNGRHQDCMIIVVVPPQQTLTERVMIAVCCGIVGIFIFVFVSYICKRHIRHAGRRHNDQDENWDPEATRPLDSLPNMRDKPPSYQEAQKTDIPENLQAEHKQPSTTGSDQNKPNLPEVAIKTPNGPPTPQNQVKNAELKADLEKTAFETNF